MTSASLARKSQSKLMFLNGSLGGGQAFHLHTQAPWAHPVRAHETDEWTAAHTTSSPMCCSNYFFVGPLHPLLLKLYNLIAMASNLRAMASNLIAMASNLIAEVVISLVSNGCREEVVGWHPKLSFLLPLIFPFGSTSVYYGCGQKRTTPFHENPPPTDTVEGIK